MNKKVEREGENKKKKGNTRTPISQSFKKQNTSKFQA